MKLFNNVLSHAVLQECHREREEFSQQAVWGCSNLRWESGIKIGVTGLCTTARASEQLSRRIIDCIQHIVPPCDEIMIQHYIWHPHSGISSHSDANHRWGATIYLNETWDMDYGGLFVWQENFTKKLNVVCPEYNTMVLNTQSEPHLVTTISPLSPENRVTIQIWGD